jgi:hypothetical protein
MSPILPNGTARSTSRSRSRKPLSRK